MAQLSIKPGDRVTIDGIRGETVLQFDRIRSGYAHLTVDSVEDIAVENSEASSVDRDIQNDLKDITDEVISLLSEMDAVSSQTMVAQFVSDLFLKLAQKRQKEERRQKQAEGIAAAKARGVRFGPTRKPLPENFDECRRRWRNGELNMYEAAEACGMAKTSFYDAVIRKEQAISRAV